VRVTTLLNKLLNLQGLRVTGARIDGDAMFVAIHRTFRKLTCPHCGCSKSGRQSKRQRTWRHLGVWGKTVFLRGEIRRLRCDSCDRTVTEAVPWARHDSDFTRSFEDAVGLMAQKLDKTAVATLFGIAWVTVGSIAERVVAELLDPERLRGLRRIGVDEISFRKRHRYLTIVTNHDTGRVVWVAEGKSSDVLKAFFREIGPEACAAIEIVTMDMSAAYRKAVEESLPDAQIAYDHFHIAKLANEALNEVRRDLVRSARDTDPASAKAIKSMRWPTLYRMDRVPEKHADSLARLRPDQPLGRAVLLKESLLDVLGGRGSTSRRMRALRGWTQWAARSRLRPFVRLGRTIRSHLGGIRAFLKHRVTNALAEGINNKIRLLSHRAYGFHSAPPLIATIHLCCGGIRLPELQLL
jgi:transposase